MLVAYAAGQKEFEHSELRYKGKEGESKKKNREGERGSRERYIKKKREDK